MSDLDLGFSPLKCKFSLGQVEESVNSLHICSKFKHTCMYIETNRMRSSNRACVTGFGSDYSHGLHPEFFNFLELKRLSQPSNFISLLLFHFDLVTILMD